MKLAVHLIGYLIAEAEWRPALNPVDGALVAFSGVVRETEAGLPILGLRYEAYAAMAEQELRRVAMQVQALYPVSAVVVVHRTGRVLVGEMAIYLAVLAPHRGEALKFVEYFLDRLKVEVPIWKAESF
jgi:molybdopterin synthase catalytic subunit